MTSSRHLGHSYSLIIATYQEAPNLSTLLPTLATLLSKVAREFEIVIVDDNSQDGTDKVIATIRRQWPMVKLIVRKNASGLASALKEGTQAAKYDHVIRMDADWSHQPSDLATMIQVYEQSQAPHVIIGSRFTTGSIYQGKPLLNRLASFMGRSASRFFFKVPLKDLSNDFRIFPRHLWQAIAPQLSIDGNTFLIQELILFHQAGASITEVPTTFKEREVGESKLRIFAELKKFLRAFPILLKNAHWDLSPRDEITPLKVRSSSSIVLLLQILLILSVTFFNYYLFNTAKITTGNTAARTLLALGPPLHLGIPYQELWEYAPPGLLAAIVTWTDAFGTSMYSFRALHATLVFMAASLLALILRKVFKSWIIESIVFFPLSLIVFSSALQTDMYSIELFGTVFALAGLAALLTIKQPVTQMAIGAGLLVAASQIKETYALCILTLLVVYWQEWRRTNLIQTLQKIVLSLYGPLTVVAIIVAYLYFHDATAGYIEVFKNKFTLVQHYTVLGLLTNFKQVITFFADTYLHHYYLIWSLILINGYLFFMQLVRSRQRLALLNRAAQYISAEVMMTLVFSGGILGGFMIYGQISPGIRMISIAVALFFVIGLLLLYPLTLLIKALPSTMNSTLIGIMLALAGVMIFSPNYLTVRSYSYNAAPMPVYDYRVESLIKARVSQDECILHIYGWEVPQTYIYTERRPCSRFFLANLLIGRPAHIAEYQQSLIHQPPAAIIYNVKGGDTNVDSFEATILNFTQVLKHCYTLDPDINNFEGYFFAPIDLYWSKAELSSTELQACIDTYGVQSLTTAN